MPAPPVMPTSSPPTSLVRRLVDGVGFQAAWWTSALCARAQDDAPARALIGPAMMAVFVAVHVALTPRGRAAAQLLLAALAGMLGVVVDGALVRAGVLAFPPGPVFVWLSPAWMVGLWVGFAVTIETTLSTWMTRAWHAAVLGAVSGPLAYAAGMRLHALTVHDVGVAGLVVVGAAWAIALPLLSAAARACARLHTTVATLRRRLVTIPRALVLFALLLVLVPALALPALVVDLARWLSGRTPPTVLRLLAFMLFYATAEAVGLLALLGAWLLHGDDDDALVRATAAIQRGWAGSLFGFVRVTFALRIEEEGFDVVTPGPVLVLVRHASIVDTLLPTVFISGRTHMLLRFVLKRELLQDPCLDVAGSRLPNHFVARDGKDTAGEVAAVAALADELDDNRGVLLYPEGTRFSPARREAAIARLRDDEDLQARARAMTHVLPPRPGGVLGLLDAKTPADVVIFAHHGLDGLSLFDDLWRGGLVGRTIRMKLWRIPRASIPTERTARVRWLYDEWARVDAWVAAHAQHATKR